MKEKIIQLQNLSIKYSAHNKVNSRPGSTFFDGLQVNHLDTSFLKGKPLRNYEYRGNQTPQSPYLSFKLDQNRFDLEAHKTNSPNFNQTMHNSPIDLKSGTRSKEIENTGKR